MFAYCFDKKIIGYQVVQNSNTGHQNNMFITQAIFGRWKVGNSMLEFIHYETG
jgi:hypothetical protein